MTNMPSQPSSARVALLGSFTLDLLPDYLTGDLKAAGISSEIFLSGFGQYRQDILAPSSGFYAFLPEFVVLAVDFSDLFGDIVRSPFEFSPPARQARVQEQVSHLSILLATVKERLPTASILVTNVFSPPSSLGLLEGNSDFSLKDAARAFNQQLEKIVRSLTGVYLVDCEALAAGLGHAAWTDDRMRHLARMPLGPQALAALGRQLSLFIRALRGRTRKVLVLDLDNTLWGGVVGEDGMEKIQLGPEGFGAVYLEFQREILNYRAQGVLLALSSKNNLADVMAVLEKHPSMLLRPDMFSAIRVDWRDKVTHLREIAAELNVALESLVFMDDNPVERELVRTHLPQVLSLELGDDPSRFRHLLWESGAFARVAITDEDRDRARIYKEQAIRDTFRQSSTSLTDFYASLEMRAAIRPVDAFSLPRVAQLTQKTNQFNLTTRRYSEAELANRWAYSLQLTDKFGDNGIVGAAVLEKMDDDTAAIDTFLLSCRVIGRTVEDAFLGFVMGEAKKKGIKMIWAEYRPTDKNEQVKDFYPRNGFQPVPGAPDRWTFNLTEKRPPSSPWIRVNEEAK